MVLCVRAVGKRPHATECGQDNFPRRNIVSVGERPKYIPRLFQEPNTRGKLTHC
jgi:hypothetical protein